MKEKTLLRVCGLGDQVIDYYVDEGLGYPGGNALNFSVYARKLGLAASYLGLLAEDELALHIRRVMAELGIDASRCRSIAGTLTWQCPVTVVDGERIFGQSNRYMSVREAAELILSKDDLAWLSAHDLVHSGIYAGVETAFAQTRALPLLRSFDFSQEEGYRQADVLAQLCPDLDLALFSCSHITASETAALAAQARALGTKIVLATRGEEGQVVFTQDAVVQGEAMQVMALDTMGAGDAFFTAFASRLLHGGWRHGEAVPGLDKLASALQAGAAFAAEICGWKGSFAWPVQMEGLL